MIFSVLKLENQAKRLFFLVLFSLLAFQQNVFSQCSTTFVTNSDCRYDPINTFSLGGVASIGNNNVEDVCNSNGYYSFSTPVRTLTIGATIPWTATVGNGIYTDGIAIWIDLNNNNVYESSEMVSSSPPGTTTSHSQSFVMPSGVTGVQLRMRVRSAYSSSITSSQACTNGIGGGYGETENYFVILDGGCTNPTISSTLAASRCGTGSVTLEATPSAGIINWYDASTSGTLVGTGTSFATPSISTTTTYYAEAVDGSCVSASRTAVVATINTTPNITSTLGASRCDAGTLTLEATPSAGTIDWFADATGGTSLFTGTTFTTPSLTTTTTYYAEVGDGSCVNATREAVVVTIGGCTKIQASQCGSIITSVNVGVWAKNVIGATNYKFEITDPSNNVFEFETSNRYFKFSEIAFINSTTYSVRVAAKVNGVNSAYGDACNIHFEYQTKIQSTQCGSTITNPNTKVWATEITGVDAYKFEITDPNNNIIYIENTMRSFTFSQFAFVNNTTYTVRVLVKTGNVYGVYDEACSIRIEQTVKIQNSQCGVQIATPQTTVWSKILTNAAGYRFELTDQSNNVTILDNPTRSFKFNQFTYIPGEVYSVRVSAKTGIYYAVYGAACNVTAPATSPRPEEIVELKSMNEPTFDFEAFPNPSNGDFTISSSVAGTYKILNELGQIIRIIEITEANGNQVKVENMPNGAYFVTGTSNGNVVTKKVIVVR